MKWKATDAKPVLMEAVDRQIAGGFRSLKFEPALEQAYEADGKTERTRYLIITALIALFLYDLFLIGDWQMLHDVFFQACVCRLAIYTPYIFVSIYIANRTRSAFVLELLATAAPVVSVLLIMVFFVQSESPYRVAYNHGTVLIMIFASILQRLRFRFAVVANICMLIVQAVGMYHSAAFDAQMLSSDAIFFVSAAILLLTANYFLERESRRSYLLALRSTLLNAQLDRNAKIDPLTGLWNRRHLRDIMDTAWAAAATAPESMAVILLDIDHFKLFNDTYGHLEGDDCLKRVGRCLSEAGHDNGEVAVRFGGEEFLIFIPGAEERDARAFAGRLRAALHHEAIAHPVLGTNAIVTASFGVAAGQAPGVTPSALLAAADTALYKAKEDGRDCIRPSNETAGAKAVLQPIYGKAV